MEEQARGAHPASTQNQDVNVFSNQVLQQYQQKKVANVAKQVPLYSRKTTSWGSRSSSSKTNLNATKRSTRNRRTKNVIDENAGNERRQAQAIQADSIFSATLRRARAEVLEVGYTPMVLEDFGNHLAFFRTVTRKGETFVQGALLDVEFLKTTWLPSIIQRRSPIYLRPTLRDEVKECALSSTSSELWSGPKLCFADEKEWSYLFWLQLFLLSLLVGAGSLMGVQGVRAAKEAQRLAKEQSRFLAAVSHELRTPLTTMRMHAELLFAGMVREEKKQKFLQDLVSESQRLSLLVENVLETSRLQAGQRSLSLQKFSLNKVVARTLEEQRSFLTQRGASIELVIEEKAELFIYADEQALKQVLLNLLDNAVKYGMQTGDSLVVVRVKRQNEKIELHVEDGGSGVKETEREDIFEPFFRSFKDGEHVVGTGIGLSLTRSLLAGMNATVVARTSNRGGADFSASFQEAVSL
ncbi:MAG: HAMP domain-containing histidine kinase [Deltaproteobacteria bacterium]|nr:HAMP domain-containing histidine kinase [Deltaproteobacteria bacterium]